MYKLKYLLCFLFLFALPFVFAGENTSSTNHGCSVTNVPGTVQCGTNKYWYEGGCKLESTIQLDLACVSDTVSKGGDGEPPKLIRNWSCTASTGCTTSSQCDQGQICSGLCQASATAQNNTCTGNTVPHSYNYCTGAPTSCIVSNTGAVSKFAGTGQTQIVTDMFHDSNSNFGVGTSTPSTGTIGSPQTLKFDVEGALGAQYYCDEDGNNCIAGDSIGSGGGGKFVDGDDPDFAVYNDGYVGIGGGDSHALTEPTHELHVNGSVLFANDDGTEFFEYRDDENMGLFSNAYLFGDRSTLAMNPSTTADFLRSGAGGGGTGLDYRFEGKLGAVEYCDAEGGNCFTADLVGSSNLPTCTNDQYLKYTTTPSAGWACEDISTLGGGKFTDGSTADYAVYDPSGVTAADTRVGINTQTPVTNFHVVGDVFIEGDGVGDSVASSAALRIGTTGSDDAVAAPEFLYDSDIRLKQNIVSLDTAETLKSVLKLNPVRYDWIDGLRSDTGFIAQEVEVVFPNFVTGTGDAYKGMSYGKMVSVLTSAIQEQQKQIESLNERITELETK